MRRGEDGVILINVLVILALSSAIVFAMIRVSDVAIMRSQRFSDASQGLALIAAGEASAVAALRRDDPAADHLNEDWAKSGQETITIEGGQFAVTLQDAQAQFNLNGLAASGAFGLDIIERVCKTLALPDDVAARIIARVTRGPTLHRLRDLVDQAGLTQDEVAALAEFLTVLPGTTEMNINTMSDRMIAIVANNAVQARVLRGIRKRNGLLTPEDMVTAGLILPAGVGFRTWMFRVTTTARIGDVVQQREALLRRGADGVTIIARSVPAQ